jgi:small neutral amino acid transporter SnatA (MarC family)
MIGTTMLLYGLINPVGVAPIYLSLVRRISPDRAHRIHRRIRRYRRRSSGRCGRLWTRDTGVLQCRNGRFSHRRGLLKRLLGNTGINIATRLMALVVASVAIDFIIKHQLAGLALKGGL